MHEDLHFGFQEDSRGN